MIHLVEKWLRTVRGACSSPHWGARWLGWRQSDNAHGRGLLLVQIDGLSYRQLQRALESGRMPFLQGLLEREEYILRRFYSGLPSTTPAVQGELFFDQPGIVPAFEFRHRGKIANMLSADMADSIEDELLASCPAPLLRQGSSWSNIFSGGASADETHFCPAAWTRSELFAPRPWRGILGLVLFDPVLWVRLPLLLLWGAGEGLIDAIGGVRRGEPLEEELQFIISRLLVGVALREGIVGGASIDLLRSLPIIHLNFLGYDERGHRRGPGSPFAHAALKGIDRSIRRLYRAAHRSPWRNYEVCILADHGQETVRSYFEEYGPIQEVLKAELRRLTGLTDPAVEVAAAGPVGHVYPGAPLDAARRETLARALVAEQHVPGVLFRDEQGVCRWVWRKGETRLDDADLSLFPHGPAIRSWVRRDLRRLAEHRDSGELVLLGWQPDGDCWSFSLERGAHGGPGPEESSGFVLAPRSMRFPGSSSDEVLRPAALRQAALHVLGHTRLPPPGTDLPSSKRLLSVMTYNVHSCIGMDGRYSPLRIAQVLARYDPDVVGLQELDCGRSRTRCEEQARLIAEELGFEFAYCPTVSDGASQYGHALLSRFPLEIIYTARLPNGNNRMAEPRAAMLASFSLGDRRIFILNTHLGLGRPERAAQAADILSQQWIGRIPISGPLIVCGDFNARPGSSPYRLLTQRLLDVQAACNAWRATGTFPSVWPVARIDHIFVSRQFNVRRIRVPRNELTRVASDHLPLIAELEVSPENESTAGEEKSGKDNVVG